MPDYTVRDKETGKVVTFRWNGSGEPSDTDLAEVFSAARHAPPAHGGPDWSMAPTFGGMAGGVGGFALGGPLGAMLGAVLGGAAGEGGKMAAAPTEQPVNAGDALLRLVTEGAKQGAVEAPGQLAGLFARPLSRRLMQSALKPSDATVQAGRHLGIRTKGDIAQAVLNEPSLLPTAGGMGLGRVRNQVDQINESIQGLLNASGRQGTPIDLTEAARPINEQAQRAMMQATPEADMATVDRLYQEFSQHPLGQSRFLAPEAGPAQPNKFLPVEQAQRLKVGTYQQNRGRYGELGTTTVETNKALGRGLKDEIATAIPEISAQNMRESELLLVEQALSDAVNRTGNRDPIGFANAAPTTQRFWLALADRSPAVKALLARAIRGPFAAGARMMPSLTRGATLGLNIDQATPQ